MAKPFVESDFQEQQTKDSLALLLTFNHIKRSFDSNGNLIKVDTVQIEQLDYSFNTFKKKKRTRVTQHRSSRCTFAEYIPKKIITTNRTISLSKPAAELNSIFIGCWELQGTKKFLIKNPNANHFTLYIYSNYYQDTQIRQKKFLIKSDK